jgi:epsilon-lactone hydrolase
VMAELGALTRSIGIPLAVALACLAAAPALGQASADERIKDDGSVTLDGVTVPLSSLMSDEARAFMRHIMLDKPFGTTVPDIAEERERAGAIMHGFLAPMRKRYAVEASEETIGGVVVDVVTPSEGIAPGNAHRVLINVHGGGFVTGARTASLVESVPLAALMKIMVISIDYRMGPEHRFPAASEDVANVYRELLKTYEPEHIGLYGCSAGGLLSAQSIAWFRAHGLPRPAAVGVFCASLGAFFGGDASALGGPLNGMLPPREAGRPEGSTGSPPSGPSYLDSARPDDPLAYPVASPEVMADFPPTLFISGTRSFEFSVALSSHNRLTQAGVDSRFHGWDGMNHAFFYNSELPESREAYAIMADFFETHLAN